MDEIRERMGLERNVGRRDRLARAALTVGFLALAGLALSAGRHFLALGSLAVAVGLGINALTGFCGLNAALGVDTCDWDGNA